MALCVHSIAQNILLGVFLPGPTPFTLNAAVYDSFLTAYGCDSFFPLSQGDLGETFLPSIFADKPVYYPSF